jgi:tetratricopeptide (TPR) repeat protein
MLLLGLCCCLAIAQEPSENYRAAFLAYKTADYAGALIAIEKAIKEQPQSGRPLLLRGRIATAQGQFKVAESDLRTALKLDHTSNKGYLYLGDLFFTQRLFEKARLEYLTFLRLEPENLDVTLKLVLSSVGAGALTEAKKLISTLDPFDEKHPAFYFASAALAQKENRAAEAEKLLAQARTLYGVSLCSFYLPDYALLFATP